MPNDKTFGRTLVDTLIANDSLRVPQYDATADAPADVGFIAITGNGTEPAGFYGYDGSGWVGPFGTGSDGDYVPASGGTFTGGLTLEGGARFAGPLTGIGTSYEPAGPVIGGVAESLGNPGSSSATLWRPLSLGTDAWAYADKHYSASTDTTPTSGSVGDAFIPQFSWSDSVVWDSANLPITVTIGISTRVRLVEATFGQGRAPDEVVLESYDSGTATWTEKDRTTGGEHIAILSGGNDTGDEWRVRFVGYSGSDGEITLSRLGATTEHGETSAFLSRGGGTIYGSLTVNANDGPAGDSTVLIQPDVDEDSQLSLLDSDGGRAFDIRYDDGSGLIELKDMYNSVSLFKKNTSVWDDPLVTGLMFRAQGGFEVGDHFDDTNGNRIYDFDAGHVPRDIVEDMQTKTLGTAETTLAVSGDGSGNDELVYRVHEPNGATLAAHGVTDAAGTDLTTNSNIEVESELAATATAAVTTSAKYVDLAGTDSTTSATDVVLRVRNLDTGASHAAIPFLEYEAPSR